MPCMVLSYCRIITLADCFWQSYGIKPVLDLDDHHAKLMREYLVRTAAELCRNAVFISREFFSTAVSF